jgi:endonuclease YncB( thermonuclease family)
MRACAGYTLLRGENMLDSLTGYVISIVSDDVFALKVMEVSSPNPDQYDEIENIHLNTIFEAESGVPESDEEPFAVRTSEDLEARLMGKKVRCMIKTRDDYGHLVSDITLMT